MSLQGLEDLLFQSMNMCDLIICGLRIITRNVSSLICITSARHERHECNTSATLATRVRHERHECYTNDMSATRVKNFDFDNDTSKNIFSHPYIYYTGSKRLWGEGQFLSKNYFLEMSLFHGKMRLTILTWKNLCFTEKIHWNTVLAASDVFHIFTQSIKFFKFHYRTDVWKTSIVKMNVYSKNEWLLPSVTLRQSLSWFLSYHSNTLFLRVFILKPTERA